jgi:hypothetical protein
MPAGIGVKLIHMRSAERELHRLILIIAIKPLLDVLVKGPVIPSTARDLFVKRIYREFGWLRFLVATLLGMTGGGARNDRRESCSERPFPRCHSERSEESAVGNTTGDGARFEEIPRRYAPRNDRRGGSE